MPHRRLSGAALFATALVAAGGLLHAQPQPPLSPDQYQQLRFRYIGPVGNRVIAIAGVPGDPNVYYAGAASGGVFKTTDAGAHWTPLFDDQPVSSIGSLAVAPSDRNVVWAGTGEGFIRSHISIGNGIYRSTDAGKNWTRMGLERPAASRASSWIRTIPTSCWRARSATRTGRNRSAGCSAPPTADVIGRGRCSSTRTPAAPTSPWTRRTRASSLPGCGSSRSTPGGASAADRAAVSSSRRTVARRGRGLPDTGCRQPPLGKISAQIARSNPNRVYALIETGDGLPTNHGNPTDSGSLWRSDDGGDTWQLVSSDRQLRGRTHYYTRFAIAPDNENEPLVSLRRIQPRRSMAAARRSIVSRAPRAERRPSRHVDRPDERQPHGRRARRRLSVLDQSRQELASDPAADRADLPRHRRQSRFRTTSTATVRTGRRPRTEQQPDRQAVARRRIRADPARRCGTRSAAARAAGRFPIRPIPTSSGRRAPAPAAWAASSRASTSARGSCATSRSGRSRPSDIRRRACKYRFVWTFPLTISPHDHNTVYVGSQHVHRTTNGGQSWEEISPDLTLNDKSQPEISGGLTPDNIGVEYAGVVFAIAESPTREGRDLGGHQRRPGAGHARWRRALDQRDEEHPGFAAVGHGQQH